jgi:hypothetical protein
MLALASSAPRKRATINLFTAGGTALAVCWFIIWGILNLSSSIDVATLLWRPDGVRASD